MQGVSTQRLTTELPLQAEGKGRQSPYRQPSHWWTLDQSPPGSSRHSSGMCCPTTGCLAPSGRPMAPPTAAWTLRRYVKSPHAISSMACNSIFQALSICSPIPGGSGIFAHLTEKPLLRLVLQAEKALDIRQVHLLSEKSILAAGGGAFPGGAGQEAGGQEACRKAAGYSGCQEGHWHWHPHGRPQVAKVQKYTQIEEPACRAMAL